MAETEHDSVSVRVNAGTVVVALNKQVFDTDKVRVSVWLVAEIKPLSWVLVDAVAERLNETP